VARPGTGGRWELQGMFSTLLEPQPYPAILIRLDAAEVLFGWKTFLEVLQVFCHRPQARQNPATWSEKAEKFNPGVAGPKIIFKEQFRSRFLGTFFGSYPYFIFTLSFRAESR
jgi:hypothetical protein